MKVVRSESSQQGGQGPTMAVPLLVHLRWTILEASC